jgi:2,4-diaminopentanoate dehydrogenase
MNTTSSNQPPYRVAVWGPGSVGAAAARELILLPETELASVLVYSEEKNNIDAGKLLGMPEQGVTTTNDVQAFLASKPECVIHAARDAGDFNADDEIIMLLEQGINVITALPYHYLKLRGDDVYKKFDDAGKKGNATLFASGMNPGFLFERMAMTATGFCNAVEHMELNEYVNCEHMPGAGEFLTLMGFGMETADPEGTEKIAGTISNYLVETLYYAAEKMGIAIDKVERQDYCANTPEDLDIPNLFKLKAGTVALVCYRWTAYSEGKPRLSTQVNWYVTDLMRPDAAKGSGDDLWTIEIDGRPGVKVAIELVGKLGTDIKFNPENPTNVALLSTAIPCVQAIPDVIKAKPGVMELDAPPFHWKQDMRI